MESLDFSVLLLYEFKKEQAIIQGELSRKMAENETNFAELPVKKFLNNLNYL